VSAGVLTNVAKTRNSVVSEGEVLSYSSEVSLSCEECPLDAFFPRQTQVVSSSKSWINHSCAGIRGNGYCSCVMVRCLNVTCVYCICELRFVKVGNNDPADGARAVADSAPVCRQRVGTRSISVNISSAVQSTVHRGSWRLGILSSVVADSGQNKIVRPG
jgi:hypothetical protein